LICVNKTPVAVGYIASGERHSFRIVSAQDLNMEGVMENGKTSAGIVIAAGAAGGMAEVLWIAVAATALGADGWVIARAVSTTVIPDLAASNLAPWIGLLIHFLLSIVLATVFARVLSRQLHAAVIFLAALAALAAVWAFNFLLLLPLIDPVFVSLLPHPVTLVSKLLFGVAMASVLVRQVGREQPVHSGKTP